jgi:hypothetical protein
MEMYMKKSSHGYPTRTPRCDSFYYYLVDTLKAIALLCMLYGALHFSPGLA